MSPRRRRRNAGRSRVRSPVQSNAAASKKPVEDRRLIGVRLRPMSIADMKPDVPYEPGLCVLEIHQFATPDTAGAALHIPLALPPELREPTDLNALVALELICAEDPVVKATVDKMKANARPYRESASFTQERCGGPVWLPPTQEAPL